MFGELHRVPDGRLLREGDEGQAGKSGEGGLQHAVPARLDQGLPEVPFKAAGPVDILAAGRRGGIAARQPGVQADMLLPSHGDL